MSMEERRWMLTASGVCWSCCLMTYFVQLDLFHLSNTQDIIAACFVYSLIGFGSLAYLYACWALATKMVLPGIPFLLGQTLVPPPFFNPNHPDYLGDLEEEDEDPLFNAAMNLLALKLATYVDTFTDMIYSSRVYLWGFRMAQLGWVMSPFLVLNLVGVVGGVRSDFGPAVLGLGFVSLMGEGYLLIFGLECFKSFYGLLVAALAGVVFITSRDNNTVATLIVCLMSTLITCLCGLYLFVLSRINSTGASTAAADAPPSQASPSPPIESVV